MKIEVDLPRELKADLEEIKSRLRDDPPCPDYLTIWQFAQIKGVSERTVQRRIADGKLEVKHMKGVGRVIHKDSVKLAS